LENVEQVRRCHSMLRNCFLRLIGKNHSDEPLFIAHVVAVLVELRSLAEAQKASDEQLAMRWADAVDIPPLLYEMWSS
jgi:hypothetical protein